jgi:hypothetical protein
METTQNTQNLYSNLYSLFDISSNKFKNEDYILQLSNQANLKFFKDELTIKYSGKGYNSIDYAVSAFIYSYLLFYFAELTVKPTPE